MLNYAQWRSKADFEAMLQNPDCRPHMAECGKLAERFEPVLYEVTSVLEA